MDSSQSFQFDTCSHWTGEHGLVGSGSLERRLWLHKGLADAIFISGVAWCACATGLTWRRSRETASLKLGLRWRIA